MLRWPGRSAGRSPRMDQLLRFRPVLRKIASHPRQRLPLWHRPPLEQPVRNEAPTALGSLGSSPHSSAFSDGPLAYFPRKNSGV